MRLGQFVNDGVEMLFRRHVDDVLSQLLINAFQEASIPAQCAAENSQVDPGNWPCAHVAIEI